MVMGKVAARIDEIQSEWAHRVTPKQRLTGSRIHRQLIVDHYWSWCLSSAVGGYWCAETLKGPPRREPAGAYCVQATSGT